jgi:hypothetical protein
VRSVLPQSVAAENGQQSYVPWAERSRRGPRVAPLRVCDQAANVPRMTRAWAREDCGRLSGPWPGHWLALAGVLLSVCACGGASDATKNRTFYDWSLGDGSQSFEQPYPSLDWPQKVADPAFVGVSVLGNKVHFSRPSNWRLRNASNRPAEPYIHYVSPNAYSFAIYQRRDPPGDSWQDIVKRYEADVESAGAKIVGRVVPMATANGQGRAFSVEREVESAKHPLSSRSREMLIRSGELVVLVQIVHQEPNFEAVDHELLRAVATIQLP